MFKAFKPSGMEKIARAMGYQGNMLGFQDYLSSDPMKQQQMQNYTNQAMQMAKGGVVRMREGGVAAGGVNPLTCTATTQAGTQQLQTTIPSIQGSIPPMYGPEGTYSLTGKPAQDLSNSITPEQIADAQRFAIEGGFPQMPNFRDATQYKQGMEDRRLSDLPDYNAFKDWAAKNTRPRIGAAVMVQKIGPDGKMINFGSPVEAEDYDNYLKSIGKEPLKNAQNFSIGQLPSGGGGLVSADGTIASAPPADYSGMTYENARMRSMQRDVKSPEEAAAINAALKRGPTGQQQPASYAEQLPQQAVPAFSMPASTYQGDDGNTYASLEDVPEGVNATEVKPQIGDVMAQQAISPSLADGTAVTAVGIKETPDQIIDPTTGQVSGQYVVNPNQATTTTATAAEQTQANQIQAVQAAPAVDSALQSIQAAQADPSDPRAQITAAQQTTSSVGNLQAAQGNAILMNNPNQRQIQAGELISGAANAQVADQFTSQIQAATATPTAQATVQGQLANLTANFNAANPPAWAAGALRAATAQMASRGLGASSIAGQALVQAALESALPIAQADAQTTAQFEAQNLSNRQQRAMLAAQQRAQFMEMEFTQEFQSRVSNAAKISDVANTNFTAQQQVQLENSRIANTMNLTNLSNSQALVMAEAASLAQLDQANLSNRQQAAVQNAQNFLQVDMANLSNRQQTNVFKAQSRIQSLFTDQAAQNAARQFNAQSQNQTDQFFANLNTQTSQFNASQTNATAQFNAGQSNAIERFNAELMNQRDQFNAQNQLIISQNNATWRREIATSNTAAINRANELNASALLDISKNAYDNLWTYYSDTMEWAWTSAENELDRVNSMAIAQLSADAQKAAQAAASSTAAGSAIGSLIGTLGSAFIEFCWVAREVYGPTDIRWIMFRDWMKNKAPRWLYKLYVKHGEGFAEYIKDKPKIKFILRKLMNLVVKEPKVRYNYA